MNSAFLLFFFPQSTVSSISFYLISKHAILYYKLRDQKGIQTPVDFIFSVQERPIRAPFAPSAFFGNIYLRTILPDIYYIFITFPLQDVDNIIYVFC